MYLRCKKQIECSKPNDPDLYKLNIPGLGKLRGARKKTLFNEYYHSFENIPYGYRPIDSLRFKAPLPPEPWEGVLDCTKSGNPAVQKNTEDGTIMGSEDCLNLNIYVKDIKRLIRYPVIVFIYGHGFLEGYADQYKPDYFMRTDVILITLNYRGGVLGFLTLNDFELEVPGNAGLKDMLLALKWIHKYIRYFQGNSRNITLMGHSSGAVAAHILMSSDKAKGLFQKVILMSGCMFNQWSHSTQSVVPYRLALSLGYNGPNNERHILAFLSLLPAESMFGWNLLNFAEFHQDGLFCFTPNVEPYEMPDSLITSSYMQHIATAWGNHLPLLIGGTSFEGLYLYSRTDVLLHKDHLKDFTINALLPEELCCVRRSRNKQKSNVNMKMINYYYEKHNFLGDDENVLKYLDLASIKFFWHGLHRTVLARVLFSNEKTYQYLFDFDSPDFNLKRQGYCSIEKKKGVAHGDDLCYLFHQLNAWTVGCDSAEYQMIQRMIAIWTAFANTSDPNCDVLESTVWYTISESSVFHAMVIGYDLEYKLLPDTPILKVWDSMYDRTPLQLSD